MFGYAVIGPMRQCIIIGMLSVLTGVSVAAEIGPAPQKILFVGASLTSRLPRLATFSLTQVGKRIQTDAWMRGGTGLAKHIEIGLLDHIREHDYDTVVLTAPRLWPERKGSFEALQQAIAVAKQSGAEVVLYNRPTTQATYQDRPEIVQPGRDKMAETIAQLALASLPVDRAFALALDEVSFETLFVEDRVHFTNVGWYLAMCVTHGILTGRSPMGLPPFVTQRDDVTMQIDPKMATRLQQWRGKPFKKNLNVLSRKTDQERVRPCPRVSVDRACIYDHQVLSSPYTAVSQLCLLFHRFSRLRRLLSRSRYWSMKKS